MDRPASLVAVASVGLFACSSPAGNASDGPTAVEPAEEELTWSQNATWTISRGASETARVVAYGDSIFAGYHGSIFTVARRSAPYVASEYLAASWQTNVEVVRRTTSGATAQQVYEKKVKQDRSYMAARSTRAVFLDMCGNDYLDARHALNGMSGACDLSRLDDALTECVGYVELAMQTITATAPTAAVKVVTDLYYPGYDADDAPLRCTDPATGEAVTAQDVLLPRIARSNYRVCALAQKYGFGCADTFAAFMGADLDANGDGVIDSVALRLDPNEAEDDYVQRITVTLRDTVHDAEAHRVADGSTVDYLGSDDIHPTYYGDTLTGWVSGSSAPDFDDAQVVDGKNPAWDRYGHERMGFALVPR